MENSMNLSRPTGLNFNKNAVVLVIVALLLVFFLSNQAIRFNGTPKEIPLSEINLQIGEMAAVGVAALTAAKVKAWRIALRILLKKVSSGMVLTRLELALLEQILLVIDSNEWGEFQGAVDQLRTLIENVFQQNAYNEGLRKTIYQ